MRLFSWVTFLFVISGLSIAEEVVVGENTWYPLLKNKPYIHVVHNGKSIKVQRVQDPNYELKGYFAKTVRKCPPFCLQPLIVADGVETYGEKEMFDFLEGELRDGDGILIDARTTSWFARGTIPGAINIPFTVLSKDTSDGELVEIIKSFGVKPRGKISFVDKQMENWGIADTSELTKDWDFRNAKTLALFCNGPECGQSPRAIRGLLKAGYPAHKLKYYRGGMQLWNLWGLTTIKP